VFDTLPLPCAYGRSLPASDCETDQAERARCFPEPPHGDSNRELRNTVPSFD